LSKKFEPLCTQNELIKIQYHFLVIFRPSHCASVKGCVETLKILDKSKADLWGGSSRGDYPIHEAAQGGHCGKCHQHYRELSQFDLAEEYYIQYIRRFSFIIYLNEFIRKWPALQ
jgi:hypothetical protein